MRSRIVGVDGANELPPIDFSYAVELTGYEVAVRQAVFLIAGLTGAIEVATQEAKAAGGLTIGILLGYSPLDASPYIALSIVIGLSEARNLIIVRTTEVLVAVGDGLVTLSEIAVALKSRKPIISINSWNIARDHWCGNAVGGNYAGI